MKYVKVSGGLFEARKIDSDTEMSRDVTKTPADGAKTPSTGKDFYGILGKKKGDMGEEDSNSMMFIAALRQIGKLKDRSKTPNKK